MTKRTAFFLTLLALTAPVPAFADSTSFEEGAFYTISTNIDGADYALTFIVPEGEPREKWNVNASKSKVVLTKLTGEPSQQWAFLPVKVSDKNTFAILSNLSASTTQLNSYLIVYRPRASFADAKDNRVSVSYRNGQSFELWQVHKRADGNFQINSLLAAPAQLGDHPEKWKEPRSLEAVKVGDTVTLANNKTANVAGQNWKIVKVAAAASGAGKGASGKP